VLDLRVGLVKEVKLLDAGGTVKYINMAFKMKGFKAHDMFDPKTGAKKVAKTYEEHLSLGKKGFTHDKPSPNKGKISEPCKAAAKRKV